VHLLQRVDVVIHVKKSDRRIFEKDGHSMIHKVSSNVGMKDGLIR
jgi:hypothetical protein